jgi:hypothetical protein
MAGRGIVHGGQCGTVSSCRSPTVTPIRSHQCSGSPGFAAGDQRGRLVVQQAGGEQQLVGGVVGPDRAGAGGSAARRGERMQRLYVVAGGGQAEQLAGAARVHACAGRAAVAAQTQRPAGQQAAHEQRPGRPVAVAHLHGPAVTGRRVVEHDDGAGPE